MLLVRWKRDSLRALSDPRLRCKKDDLTQTDGICGFLGEPDPLHAFLRLPFCVGVGSNRILPGW